MNWILVIVVVILLFMAIRGAYRGFLRIVFSLIALVLVIVIAAAAAPKISSFLTENTGIYDRLEARCVERVSSYMDSEEFEINLGDALASYSDGTADTDTDSGDAAEDASDSDESSSLLTGDWVLPSLIEDYLADAVLSGDTDSGSSETTEEESADDAADETMTAVTEQLSDMTAQAKEQAAEAVGARIASILLTIITYIIAVIAAIIVVKIIGAVIGLIGRLPVIGGINRVVGLLAGIVEGLLICWVLLLLLSVIGGTESGSAVSAMIAENTFLTWLYNNNPVLGILSQFLSF